MSAPPFVVKGFCDGGSGLLLRCVGAHSFRPCEALWGLQIMKNSVYFGLVSISTRSFREGLVRGGRCCGRSLHRVLTLRELRNFSFTKHRSSFRIEPSENVRSLSLALRDSHSIPTCVAFCSKQPQHGSLRYVTKWACQPKLPCWDLLALTHPHALLSLCSVVSGRAAQCECHHKVREGTSRIVFPLLYLVEEEMLLPRASAPLPV